MASCPACDTPHSPGTTTCAACGAPVAPPEPKLPSFELDVPRRAAPVPASTAPATIARAAAAPASPVSIDLAYDPRAAFAPAPARGPAVAGGGGFAGAGGGAPLAVATEVRAIDTAYDDVDADAKLLAEYGEPPRHWLMTGPYAWRVLRRRRELKHALTVRRAEAGRARTEVDDAFVVFAERARSTAEQHPDYADALEQLRRAEDVLRSRDRVLAAENDAHSARLASVDARIAKLDAEREQARAEERNAATQLATAQAELARAEAGLKRAESELRAAAQRDATRGRE
jgi:hypothetical protein